MDIQVNDDIVIRFKEKTELTVYESADVEVDNPIIEEWEEASTSAVTVFQVDEHILGVQFGDGTISFIPHEFVEVIEINGETQIHYVKS